ncbi:MAG: type II secretion system F family protein [Kiloniellales bacterium]
MDLGAILGNGQLGPEFLAVLLVLPLGLMLLLFAVFSGGDNKVMARRLKRAKGHPEPRMPEVVQQKVKVKRSTVYSEIPAIHLLIKRLVPQPEVLRQRLSRTGWQLTIGNYLLACLTIAIVTAGGSFAIGLLPIVAALPAGLFSGLALPYLAVGIASKRRQTKFIASFPEAIDLMVRGIKSGLPISEAIRTAGEEVPDPVGVEMRRIVDGIKFGRKLEEMLWEVSHRLDIQEFKFFTVALSIQTETGGNLAETLENLSDVLRRRRQLKLKIKALSSEAKASAYIIGSLPFVMAVLIFLMNSAYIMQLYFDPRGNIMVGVGLLSFFIGAGVMYKMVKFEI